MHCRHIELFYLEKTVWKLHKKIIYYKKNTNINAHVDVCARWNFIIEFNIGAEIFTYFASLK